MTSRIDPFLVLDPYARLLLRQVTAGHDLPALALPRHAGLVRALSALLREPAPAAGDGTARARLLAAAPDLAPHVTLLERCAERLIDVLAGRVPASDVMFPEGSMALVEPIYRGNRWTDHFNRLTAIAVARAVATRHAQDAHATVRVLEVGAGTGGTTAAVLAALDPHAGCVVYDYTDVSPGFVQHGRRVHGMNRPYLQGRLLDLEKPPAAQGFAPASYDVVLGTNVLHATSHIATSLQHVHAVLRPGGLLLLNEITRGGAFATMTFGLLDGWWAFRDGEMRLPDAPLLSVRGWRGALRAAGFNAPAVYGWTDPPDSSFQCLFVAAREAALTAADVSTQMVAPVPTPSRTAAAAAAPVMATVSSPAAPTQAATAAAPAAAPRRDLRPLLTERLAALLGLEPGELASDRPFAEVGVDSIVAPQFVSLLNRELGSTLVPTDMFNHATIDALADHLGTMTLAPAAAEPDAAAPCAESPAAAPPPSAVAGDDIAVIGLACRFPGAADADAFWRNLVAGHCAITDVPPERWNGRRDGITRWGGFLDEYDCFDPEFFNLSWREAEAMSPQQRVFLEQAWHALENAGYGRRALAGQRCGVFVGAAPDGYGMQRNDSLSALGGSLAILSARISYLLDLKGPSMPVDTACSSSAVAVHLACQSILAGDCDMALAGGVSILMTNPRLHAFLDDAGMLSPTGQCHTFDAAADGFVPGEGCGVVVLKRLDRALADRDAVLGVIKASGINQDGRTSGITAPSGPAQTALETAVYRKAGIDPASITLIEAHGTGTQLGDPIEVKALEAAFRGATGRTGFCALGSVKTNIGHALAAAGVAGLIKVLLALRHGTIPASLHYTTDNPEISFAGSPFFVPRQAMPWTAALRLAAVSSFGFSGTNAHFVVGEAPPRPAPVPVPGPALILLSARTEDALEARCTGLLAWLADNRPALADLAFTLSQGRGHYEHRLALLVDSIDDLRAGRGRVWRSKALTLPARDGQDAEMASLLAAAEPDLARIADCYVRGGDGDWSGLAPPTARRLPLPAYPFARLRFATRGLDVDAPVGARLHPMLRENVSTLDGVAYRLDLDEAAPWLRDHRFGGAPVVPAVAYLELARAVGSLAGGRAVAGVADLHLERPLTAGMTARITLRAAGDGAAFAVLGTPDAMVGTGGPSAAFTVPSSQASTGAALPDAAAVDIAGGGSTIPGVMVGAGRPSTTFTVPGAQASAGAGPFDAAGREVVDGRPVPIMTLGAPTPRDAATNQGDTRHAGGRILFAVPTVVPPADSPDVIAQRLPSRFSQAEVYARFAALGFSYGPAFQVIRSLRASSTEALAELVPAVPAEAGMVLDPALLDGAVQAAIGLMMAGGEALSSVVPVSVGQAVFLGPVTGPCFAHVRAMGGDADTRRLEITVTDRTGRVLTALCDLVVRVAAARSATLDCLAYAPVWEAAPVPAADRPAAVLLFDRDETIWRALGGDTILVRPGSAFCRLDRTCFVIDPSSEADYARLLETLRAEALLPPTTWHLWSRSAAAGVEVGEAAPHAMVGADRSSEASTPSDAEAADGAALSDAAGVNGVGGQSTPLRVTVGAGRSSTTFTSLSGEASDGIGLSDAAGAKVVDGRPAPTMTPGGPATPAGVDRPSAASAPPRDPAVAEAADILRHGLRSVMLLAAAFARLSPVDPVRILHVHADPARDAPLHTAVGGFAAAVRRENPLLRVRSVGVPAMAPERLIACLSAASGQGEEAEHWAADGMRLVRRLVAVNLPPPVGLRPGGVFLLTGAMGGIGRLLALHLARRCRARLLLVGRSPPDASVDALIAAIRAAGGEAACHAADVSDPAQASAAAAAARARFGALHGVIHAAGVTRDRFLLHKTAADIDAVLAPKIAGTLALDRATAQDDLDVFICFSSLAGSLGNAGQSDYSAANRFLDAFMATRTGPGRSLSIGWPYWTAGGLHVDAEEQARRTAATGILSLETEQGLALFDALAGSARGAVLLLPGKADALSSLVIEAAATSDRPRPGDAAPDHDAVAAAVAYLRGLLADATAMPADRINPDRPLEQYGIDSILVTRMNAALERDFPAVPKTLFFEHQTLRSAAAYLAARHAAALPASSIATGVAAPRETVPASAPHPLPCHEAPRVVTDATAPAGVPVPAETMPTARHAHPAASPAHRPVVTGPVPPRTDGIAIIGIAGRYPGAGTLEAFWDNLCADRDLITDIPPERWNHAAWFDARPGTPGRSYSKWGGFLDGVDLFDPLFFNIAPAEAAGIDPNERLFLETCWEALENAGHTRATLSRDARRAVGVYAGVMYGEYQVLAAMAQAAGAGGVGGASPYWSIANRVSYHLDLHGPSVAVDTACSSSLTAIHLACQALSAGECDVAIAGGVNLSLHPLKYVGLSQGRFAASDGRCHSFAAGGDGYVPGEGVGAVVLKPLAVALADGDHVHAVIRGWAANHGGKTNGYTVPNPVQQGAVIAAAMRRGGIDPATVSYVEAHGTGTALGDPIEIAGLAAAFGDGVPRQSCALGSVKANIGHLEAAAGIAGLTRVVLQLQHRTLTPTRRHGPDNPNIDFAATPFRLQRVTEPWTGAGPLRAGISSFGAGGANAHLIVEEFHTPRAAPSDAEPALLVLSARTGAQLRAYAARMAAFLRRCPYRLADVCRTLQTGREAMAVRLAAVTGSLAEAAAILESHAAGRPSAALIGTVDEATVAAAPPDAGLTALARAWIGGAAVDWAALALAGERVPLPPHPFMRRSYWLAMPETDGQGALHPFLDRAEPSVDGAVLVRRFDPADAVVRDHVVQGRTLVPGVVQLEMARAAAAAAGVPVAGLADVAWPAPFEVADNGTEARIVLRRTGEGVSFAVRLVDGGLVCQGRIVATAGETTQRLDPAGLVGRAERHLDAGAIYDRLAALGLAYGAALRSLTDVWVCDGQVVAALAPPVTEPSVGWPPAVLDGALQALLGFVDAGAARLLVPFALARIEQVGALAAARYVLAVRRPAAEGMAVFDLTLTDVQGAPLLRLTGLAARAAPESVAHTAPPAPTAGVSSPRADGLAEPTTPEAVSRAAPRLRPDDLAEPAALGAAAHAAPPKLLAGMPPIRPDDLAEPAAPDAASGAGSAADVPLTICRPVWQAAPLLTDLPADAVVAVAHDRDDLGVTAALAQAIGAARVRAVSAGNPEIGAATHLVWVVAPARSRPDLASAAETAALALLRAAQALDRAGRLGHELRLHLVTQGLQSVSPREQPDPVAGAVVGVAKCIALEFPRVAVTLTDLDAAALADPRLPAMVLAESPALPVQEVAWRGGQRHVLTMAPCQPRAGALPLRPGAGVLIVGGAGGIGLALAAWLIRDLAARVALVGRRPITQVADRIAAIEAGAGAIRYIQADAANPAAMRAVIADLRGTWGGVDAAIHAALVLRDRTLARMDEATFRAVLAPKIAGSVALAEALADEPLQVLAFLSSVNVISGSRGQSNYVAGSSFVDAYARHLAAVRPWRVVVTDWGLWGDVGVVADETYRRSLARQGVHPIQPDEGIATFAAILGGTADRVAVARAEPAALRQLGLAPAEGEMADGWAALDGAETAFAALERYGRVAVRSVLDRLAGGPSDKAWTTEGLRRRIGIAPRHAMLFAALLDALARDGLIGAADGLWRLTPTDPSLASDAAQALDRAQRAASWLAGPRRLLQTCLDAYPALLRGEVDPVAVLFPQASMGVVEAAYAGNPVADHFNAAIAAVVHRFVTARPADQPVRIVELGAGTGSTTAAVLEALAPFADRVAYVVTDVSQRFLHHGQARFAGRPGVDFALYDVERDAAANGQPEGTFDLVLAANVLHATADLAATLGRVRRLLRPGGRLLLSEATRAQDFGTLVFGLTPGWWLAADRSRRLPFSPLATVETWQALLRQVGFATADAVTAASGDAAPHALLIAENRDAFAALAVATPRASSMAAAPAVSLTRLQDHLRAILADVLKLDAGEVRLNETFDRYGLESLTALEVRNRLDRDIPGLPATLLFEHNTLARLAAWLSATHADAVGRLFPDGAALPAATTPPGAAPVHPAADDETVAEPVSRAAVHHAAAFVATTPPASAPSATDEPIAVIGFHGRYPGGADADAFWRLLHAGDSAITEVPPDRWPAAATFDPAGGEGASYTKWAGFIPDIDCFDPLFFAISPLDAEVMDPQERLFLETAWATLEQAGYTPKRLRERAAAASQDGGDVGVFVGTMNAPYQWVAAEAWGAGHANAAATSDWSIANRVSFLFDFSGPSMVVDTACSASLTAIHLACESLRRGECGAALAGGVNLILHPRQFINLSQARMVSRGAECRAFGAGADGFVDGEGVGAVLLKPLSAALRDGDRIEGVILGSAVNAGGRTSGFTVPNPKAQARVIRAALRRAGVAPETVSYVEAHGTGTALGDPIEIAGLTEVFATPGRAPCVIGAVKANIGHLESAAGIAGLTKVLLQFRHRTVAPLRHAATPNPLIDLAATPFVLPAAPLAWNPPVPGGRLRAGISSFGAGGANAHLVIEDYPDPPPRAAAPDRPDLVILSARDDDRLTALAAALLDAIRARPVSLPDLAHTLRVGREAMAARLAVHAGSLSDLERKLESWLAGAAVAGVLSGAATSGTARLLAETPEGEALLAGLLSRADLDRLARLWVEGAEIDWAQLPIRAAPRLVPLPTYPFRRERYWLPVALGAAQIALPEPPPAEMRAIARGVDARTTDTPAEAGPVVESAATENPAVAPAAEPGVAGTVADTPAPDMLPEPSSADVGTAGSAAAAAEPGPSDQPARMGLFARAWQAASTPLHRAPSRLVLLSDDDELADRLAALWPSALIRVRSGPGFTVTGPGALRLDPALEADHAALIAHLAPQEPDGFAIVQALDWRGCARDRGAGVRTSILLTQAVQRSGTANVRILHLFADTADRPLDEAVGALARSAMQESPDCRLRAVGLAGPADAARAAAVCRSELLAADDAPEIRHGPGGRQAPSIEPVAVDPQAATIGFRIGGAYLLVGGLGEVGCAIAERLGRDYRARIAIIGRSKPRGPALERLNRLREAGIPIQYEACDLNDRAGLDRALAAIRRQLGRLHGVMHLARTVEDALLVRKSAASVARVMAAKVEGSATLDEALAREDLDWFVLCSSLAAWLGLAGGGDYALACAFQNGFARLRQQKVERGERSGRTVAICWPQWRHDRYLNDAKLRRLAAEGLQTIDARDGLRIIAQALQSGRTEVAAVKGADRALQRLTLAYRSDTAPVIAAPAAIQGADVAAELRGLTDAELAAYLAYLRQAAAAASPAPVAASPARPPAPERPAPAERAGQGGAAAQETVLETICGFLKLPRDRFSTESEFAEFGLDSIKALHVAERLQKRLGVPVDPAMFYEFPRIGAFAQAVAARSDPRVMGAAP